MKKIDCDSIIFDMDGVLVDVGNSYRMAVKSAVNFYMKNSNKKPRVTKKDVDLIKEIPGFNNDWDASYRLVRLLEQGINFRSNPNLIKKVPKSSRITGKFLEIKDLFQNFYLGSGRYYSIYRKEPKVKNFSGFAKAEKALISLKLLQRLKRKFKLGIATGRPRLEAIMTLKDLRLVNVFDQRNLVALEDSVREKPYPDPLLKAAEILKTKRSVYIGDSINDVIAAKKAKMPCIFIGSKNLGDLKLKNTEQLKEVFL